VLMFLAQSWNLGILANFIAEVFSTRRGVELTCLSYKYSSIFLSHTISFIAFVATTYSSFVVESIGTECLHDLQEMIVDPRLMRYLQVDTPFSLSPTKSKLQYLIMLNSSTLEYLSSKY
jgi:hypothetical protein